MTAPNLSWTANDIWGIADDMPRHVYVRGQFPDGFFPKDIASAAHAALERTKQPVLDMQATPDADGVTDQGADGTAPHPSLDTHGRGTVFEERVRRFNEENKEKAGEHLTPHAAVTLIAKLVLLPNVGRINSGPACLTTAPARQAVCSRWPSTCCTGSRKSGSARHPRTRTATRSKPAADIRCKAVFQVAHESTRNRHPSNL